MTQKNDTPILVAALLLTVALLGGAGWWLTRQFGGGGLPSISQSSSSSGSNSGVNSGTSGAANSNVQTSFADVANIPSGIFSYGGSTSWAPIRRDIDPQITQAHPGYQFRYVNPTVDDPGSGTGIQMLIDGQLAFAQSSRSLNPEELQAAQQRGFSLKEVPVALEAIAIAVHPDLNIPGLTTEQLRNIYTGQITNWNQVGGPNLGITPYTRASNAGGTAEFFQKTVLGGQAFGRNAQTIATTTQALREVAKNRGGIYYASAPEVVGQCQVKPLPLGQQANQLIPIHQGILITPEQCPNQRNTINAAALLDGSYPITRRLTVIVKENGQIDEQAGNAYAELILSPHGQQLLINSGFGRIQ